MTLSRLLDRFPYPISTSVEAFSDFVATDQRVAAWLQARDVFEVTTRFLVAMALRCVARRAPPATSPPDAAKVAALALSDERPPSLGTWVAILETLVRELRDPAATGTQDVLPGLYDLLFRRGRRSKDPPNEVLLILKEAVFWRNQEIGHGALGRGAAYLSRTVAEKQAQIERLLELLEPLLTGIRLIAQAEGHTADLTGPRLPAQLIVADPTSVEAENRQHPGVRELLHPLVRLVTIDVAGEKQPAIALFEKRVRSARGSVRTDAFLDYGFGQRVFVRQDWAPLDTVDTEQASQVTLLAGARRLLASSAQAHSAPLLEAIASLRLGFADADSILERAAIRSIHQAIDGQDFGFVLVTGKAGTGKSWLAAALQSRSLAGLRSRDTLVVHFGPGAAGGQSVFASTLALQARDRLNVVGCVVDLARSRQEAQDSLLRFCEAALEHTSGGELIVVLDGLDEVSVASEGSISPLDYLPPLDGLPSGVHLVLTSRPEPDCPPHVREAVERIRYTASEALGLVTAIELDPLAAEQQSLAQRLVATKLPDQPPELQAQVVSDCGGNLLRAAHLCALVGSGGLRSLDALGSGFADLYGAYLENLRSRLGGHVFDRLHGRLLATLAVARSALSLDDLADILDANLEDVFMASLDLRDFLLSARQSENPLPALSVLHDEFRQFVRDRPELSSTGHVALARWATRLNGAEVPHTYHTDYLAFHLACAGHFDELAHFLTEDLARVASGSPTRILDRLLDGFQDWQRLVALCRRRDILAALDDTLKQAGESVSADVGAPQTVRRALRIARLQVTMACSDARVHSQPAQALEHLATARDLLDGSWDGEDEAERSFRGSLFYKLYEAYSGLGKRDMATNALRDSLACWRLVQASGSVSSASASASAILWCVLGLVSMQAVSAGEREALLTEARAAVEVARRRAVESFGGELARLEGTLAVASARHAESDLEKEHLLSTAADAYRRARSESPADRHLDYTTASTLGQLASIRLQLDQRSECETCLREAEALVSVLRRFDPANPHYDRLDAHQRRLRARLAAGDGRYPEAVDRMHDALSLMQRAASALKSAVITAEVSLIEKDLAELTARREQEASH